ncbi:hypothetical protein Hanom_Chr12g01070531 [Helianthus anomalus]
MFIRVYGVACGKGRQTPAPTIWRGGKANQSVTGYRFGKKMIERDRVLWVGSIPISTNHTFFLNSLPLHQVSKPLPTLFTKV